MVNSRKQYNKGSKTGQVVLGFVLFVALLIIGLVLWWFRTNVHVVEDTSEPTIIEKVQIIETESEQQSSSEQTGVPKELFDEKLLQEVLDNWALNVAGTASVVLLDTESKELASVNKDRKYFTASIYKLFVAYAGYTQLDEGLVDPNEAYINGHSRAECLDLMIRESDSPCAEKLWNEIGKLELTKQLVGYGINDTSMSALYTTATDVAIMLARIADGEGMTDASQSMLLESMKTQVYRDALNVGFSDDVIVYNKIGFNEQKEYHDTAIVEFRGSRILVVSVLTDGVGTQNIAELARMIEEIVN